MPQYYLTNQNLIVAVKNESKMTPNQLFLLGRIDDAITAQRSLVSESATLRNYLDLAHFYFVKEDFVSAADAYRSAHEFDPTNGAITLNVGLCYARSKTYGPAKQWLNTAITQAPELAPAYDALCTIAASEGDPVVARRHGAEALRLKDEQSLRDFRPYPTGSRSIPKFNTAAPHRNIISFSLWGSHPKYIDNAIRNAVQIGEIFPEWRARFYCEESSVPPWTVYELSNLGADVVLMKKQSLAFEALFWRFLPVNDSSLDRVLVRDVDSVVTYRERLAVLEWLDSDRHFHLMRDSSTHTDLVLAGLWGAVAGILPRLQDRIDVYTHSEGKSRNIDQRFLGKHYWPEIKKSVLIHDSWFGNFSARDFPANSALDSLRHVGGFSPLERHFVSRKIFRTARGSEILESSKRTRYVFTVSSGYCGTDELAELIQLNCEDAEVHHQRDSLDELGLHTPDASHIAKFNSLGNVPTVARFWQRKFNAIKYGERATYVETSHMLWLSGLLENLPLLGDEAEIHLVVLNGQEEDVARSVLSSLVFARTDSARSGALDPNYPRNAIRPGKYLESGMSGRSLWYLHEDAARSLAYQRLLGGRSNVHFHYVQSAVLSDAGGARTLLASLGLPCPDTIRLPQSYPETAAATSSQHDQGSFKALIESFK